MILLLFLSLILDKHNKWKTQMCNDGSFPRDLERAEGRNNMLSIPKEKDRAMKNHTNVVHIQIRMLYKKFQ